MRALERAIEIMGGQSDLARELSERTGQLVRQNNIWSWLNRTRRVPPEMAPYIEAATMAKGAQVPRERLCPDFPWGDVSQPADRMSA